MALAGGLNRTAKSNHAVIIRNDRQGQQHEQTVDLKEAGDLSVCEVRQHRRCATNPVRPLFHQGPQSWRVVRPVPGRLIVGGALNSPGG